MQTTKYNTSSALKLLFERQEEYLSC